MSVPEAVYAVVLLHRSDAQPYLQIIKKIAENDAVPTNKAFVIMEVPYADTVPPIVTR